MLGDMVIGITTGKIGESYKVDIGAYLPAQLSFYSFEGATKKSKPDLKVRILNPVRKMSLFPIVIYIRNSVPLFL